MPTALRFETVTTMRRFIETSMDNSERLRTALALMELGETVADSVIKKAMAGLSERDIQHLSRRYIQPALEYLRDTDPVWASEWVAIRISEGVLYDHDYWLRFATAISSDLVDKYLCRLETEDLTNRRLTGMIAVIAAGADARTAARVFGSLRKGWKRKDATTGQPNEFESQVMRQLEVVFRGLPDDIAAEGVISSTTVGDALDIKVAAGLLSRAATFDVEPLSVANDELRTRLRAYLKGSVDLVLRQEDLNGEEAANLISSIAQVGEPEDMADLMILIRADIERMQHKRATPTPGHQGHLGNVGSRSYAHYNIAAAMYLDAARAEQLLIDLLPEEEYRTAAAAAMALNYVPRPERRFDRTFRSALMWAAREGSTLLSRNEQRRKRFAAALRAGARITSVFRYMGSMV